MRGDLQTQRGVLRRTAMPDNLRAEQAGRAERGNGGCGDGDTAEEQSGPAAQQLQYHLSEHDTVGPVHQQQHGQQGDPQRRPDGCR